MVFDADSAADTHTDSERFDLCTSNPELCEDHIRVHGLLTSKMWMQYSGSMIGSSANLWIPLDLLLRHPLTHSTSHQVCVRFDMLLPFARCHPASGVSAAFKRIVATCVAANLAPLVVFAVGDSAVLAHPTLSDKLAICVHNNGRSCPCNRLRHTGLMMSQTFAFVRALDLTPRFGRAVSAEVFLHDLVPFA